MGTKYYLYFNENNQMVFNEIPDRPMLKPVDFIMEYFIVGPGNDGWYDNTKEGGFGGGSGGQTIINSLRTTLMNEIIVSVNSSGSIAYLENNHIVGAGKGEGYNTNPPYDGDSITTEFISDFGPYTHYGGDGYDNSTVLSSGGGGASVGYDGNDASSGLGGTGAWGIDSSIMEGWWFTDGLFGQGGRGIGINDNPSLRGQNGAYFTDIKLGSNEVGNGGNGGFRDTQNNIDIQGGIGSNGIVILKYEGSPKYIISGMNNHTRESNGYTYHIFFNSGKLVERLTLLSGNTVFYDSSTPAPDQQTTFVKDLSPLGYNNGTYENYLYTYGQFTLNDTRKITFNQMGATGTYQNWTFLFWIKPLSNTFNIFSTDGSPSARPLLFKNLGSEFVMEWTSEFDGSHFDSDDFGITKFPITTNEDIFIGIVKDDTTGDLKLFKNDSLIYQNFIPGDILDNWDNLQFKLGGAAGSGDFLMKRVMIFNRGISTEEINNITDVYGY